MADVIDIEPLSSEQREILTRLHRSVLELVNASLSRDLAGTDFADELRAGKRNRCTGRDHGVGHDSPTWPRTRCVSRAPLPDESRPPRKSITSSR